MINRDKLETTDYSSYNVSMCMILLRMQHNIQPASNVRRIKVMAYAERQCHIYAAVASLLMGIAVAAGKLTPRVCTK